MPVIDGMMTIMRYSREHKGRVRQRIIRAAAARLRRDGLDGPSVPDFMKGAGLTHGGFYGYFRGRDELLAEAVRTAAEQTAEKVFGSSADLETVLAAYLSQEHLHHAEEGCVVAALGSEGRRRTRKVRAAFSDVADGLVRLVQEKLNVSPGAAGVSDQALAVTAQMVGAVVLARLITRPELARRIMAAGRAGAVTLAQTQG